LAEVVTLYGGAAAPLSISLFVATCAYPCEPTNRHSVCDAMAALLEAHGAQVSMQYHLGFRRYGAWRHMTPRKRDGIFDGAAYRLLSRRLAAIELGFLRSYRPADRSLGAVHEAFGRYLTAGNERLGRFRRSNPTAENVAHLVWRESRPVLHLAYAIRAELDRQELSVWDWPLLAATRTTAPAETSEQRLIRMVATAATWQTALRSNPLGAAALSAQISAEEQITVRL
jgi:hypothetical protein